VRYVLLGCFALLALAACSDATGSSQALRAEALHFDSLATLATQSHANETRLINLQVITNGLGHGAVPGVVTMTIAGTPVGVHVIGIQAVDTTGPDGRVYVAGWVDADADTSIAVDARQTATGFVVDRVALVIGDSSASTQTFPSPNPFTVQNTSASCANYPITNQIATATMLCHLGKGTVSFTADVVADAGAFAATTTITSGPVTFGIAQFDGL